MKTGRRTWGWKDAFSARGYFGKQIAANRGLWFWSAALALICTLITYPGIFYSDSYVRVTTGHAVLNNIIMTLKGSGSPLNTENGFTLIPSFFMAGSIWMSGTVGLYAFLQAFVFFAAVFLLIQEMNPAWKKVQYVLFACCPLVFGVSTYFEAGVGCAAGLVVLLLLLRRVPEEKSRADRMLEFFLVVFFSLTVFGYRTNALTVTPVLVFYLLRLPCPRLRKATMVLAMAFGIVAVEVIPAIFRVHGLSNGMTGFVWEILTSIQRMNENERGDYLDYLDEIGGPGSTQRALETSTEDSANNFVWGDALNMSKMSEPEARFLIPRKYIQLIREKPDVWIRVKADFFKRTMGLGPTLDDSEYDYNRWGDMAAYGFNDSLQRRAFYEAYVQTCRIFLFFIGRPWAVFLASIALAMLDGRRKPERRKLNGLILWTAGFFYGAFLLVNVSFEVRFFYPSLLLMAVMDGAVMLDVLRRWIDTVGKRVMRKKEAATV